MTEIIPDTSKYTDLPNKLRALALILELTDEPIQKRLTQESAWCHIDGGRGLVDMKIGNVASGADYRVPPKPRELWACEFESGYLGATWDTEEEARKSIPGIVRIVRIVRFVEQP